MPIDPNIALSIKPIQLQNPLEQYGQVMQLQQAQNQNRLADLMYGAKQREVASDNALAQLLASGDKSPKDVASGLASQGYGNKAMSYIKQQQDAEQQRAEIGLKNAQTSETKSKTAGTDFDLSEKRRSKAIAEVAAFTSPNDVIARLNAHASAGDITPEYAQSVAQTVPSNPADFPAWQMKVLKQIMAPQEAAKYTAPDANTVATNATSRANNAATNATSRANNAATISKDLLVAGFDKNGNPTGDMETTARAIANGQLPPPSGMALTNPKNQRILSRVMEINPNYDFTDVTAKKKAASDFTTGNQGNAMRSFAVAGQHLDQLGQLVDALDNGNMQIVNKVGNAYAAQTGSPAPTNFNAAKDVVSKEVMKAIIGGGIGGVDERKELANSMSQANSPAQLKGVIAQYRNLMAAQHDALLQQRRAAGLSDATLPQYPGADAQPNVIPANVQSLLNKYK